MQDKWVIPHGRRICVVANSQIISMFVVVNSWIRCTVLYTFRLHTTLCLVRVGKRVSFRFGYRAGFCSRGAILYVWHVCLLTADTSNIKYSPAL